MLIDELTAIDFEGLPSIGEKADYLAYKLMDCGVDINPTIIALLRNALIRVHNEAIEAAGEAIDGFKDCRAELLTLKLPLPPEQGEKDG